MLLRPNAVNQIGGDLIQIQSIAENLNLIPNFEVTVDIWSVDWNPLNIDLVLIFNEKPLLLLDILMKTKGHDIKVAFAPIHHSDSEVIRIFSNKHKIINLLSKVKFETNKLHTNSVLVHLLYLLSDIISIKRIYGIKIALTKFWQCRVIFLGRKKFWAYFNNLTFISFLSKIEKDNFERDYGYQAKNVIFVPNGIPQKFEKSVTPWDDRKKDIVVVGRVENRKGQLAIVKHLGFRNLRIDFLGPMNPNNQDYFKEFINIVESIENFCYLGEIPHEKMASKLQNYKVLLLNSHAEVLSLVELEAASLGLYVVTTTSGGSKEYINKSQLFEYEFGDLDTASEICEKIIRENAAPLSTTKVMTWMEVSRIYANNFERVLNKVI